MISCVGCMNVLAHAGKCTGESRIIFGCSNSLGTWMYNVKVKLPNLKTLLILVSVWKNNSSPLINNKSVSLFYPRAKGFFSLQIDSPSKGIVCRTSWGFWKAKLEDYSDRIKKKLILACISKWLLLIKTSVDILSFQSP